MLMAPVQLFPAPSLLLSCLRPAAVVTFPLLLRAALPMHLPQLIPAMQHYHWVLKTCHAGAELDTALNCAQGFVDGDLRSGGAVL